MFKAILFDLDATLLNIDMNIFMQKYFAKMGDIACELGIKNSDCFVDRILHSTGIMIDDLDPELTNENVFMQELLRDGRYKEKEKIRDFFNYFYETGFPQLKIYCHSFPGIPEMMQKVISRCKVVIATNAVFPLSALQQRLNWAGIGHMNYELITSYEIMHFCKPHIEYYQEILDLLEVEPKDCLMVGNDMGEDLPAQELGIKTFLVEDMLIEKSVPYVPDWRGRLPDLYAFLDCL